MMSQGLHNNAPEHFDIKIVKAERDLDEITRMVLEDKDRYLKRTKLELLLKTIPNSIYALVNSTTREIVGCLTCVPHHKNIVVVGQMFIKPDLRRRGLGTRLLGHVVDRRTKLGQTISLFSSCDSLYLKLGFRALPPECQCYRISLTPRRDRMCDYATENPLPENMRVLTYSKEEHLSAVVAYDCRTFQQDTEAVMNVVLGSGDVVMVAVNRKTREVVGYSVAIVRPSDGALIVQGVIADSSIVAFWLFRSMLRCVPDAKKFRITSMERRPFLTYFGDVTVTLGGYSRMVIGNDDVRVVQTKMYAMKGADFTY